MSCLTLNVLPLLPLLILLLTSQYWLTVLLLALLITARVTGGSEIGRRPRLHSKSHRASAFARSTRQEAIKNQALKKQAHRAKLLIGFKREAAQELAAALDKASVTVKQGAEVHNDAAVRGCTVRHEQRDNLTGKHAAALHEQGVIHSGIVEQEARALASESSSPNSPSPSSPSPSSLCPYSPSPSSPCPNSPSIRRADFDSAPSTPLQSTRVMQPTSGQRNTGPARRGDPIQLCNVGAASVLRLTVDVVDLSSNDLLACDQ